MGSASQGSDAPRSSGTYGGLLRYVAEVVLAVAIGFAVGGALMYLGGYDPFKAYSALFSSAFSLTDPYYIAMTLSFASPVMLTGLTFAVGVRAGLFNIGAEGQVYMGALGAVIAASLTLPDPLYLPLEFLIGVGLAVLWSLIAALLKVWRNVNEVVSTIMLNWTAFWIVEYSRVYVYPDPVDASKTIRIPKPGRLPLLIPGTELSAALLIALAAAFALYYLLWFTVVGYEIRAAGLNPSAARYGGVDARKVTLYAFLIGGVVAGLAGVSEVAGKPPHYAITTGLSNLAGLGFDGIAVSLIGANHPLGIIPASIFIGMLAAGSRGMQIEAGVPLEMVKAVQGIIIVALAMPGLIRFVRRYLGVARSGG